MRCECWGEEEQTHPPHNTPCTSHTFTNFKQSQPAHFHQLACGRVAARLLFTDLLLCCCCYYCISATLLLLLLLLFSLCMRVLLLQLMLLCTTIVAVSCYYVDFSLER